MSTYKLSDVTALNGNPVVQINNSDSVLGAVPGSMVQIGTEQIVFLDSVDIENSQITLTTPWPYADAVSVECTIAPMTVVSTILNAITKANELVSKSLAISDVSSLFSYSSVAALAAAYLNGDLQAGVKAETDGYYEGSTVGGLTYILRDVTVSTLRPPEASGPYIHVGSGGKYLEGLIRESFSLESFGADPNDTGTHSDAFVSAVNYAKQRGIKIKLLKRTYYVDPDLVNLASDEILSIEGEEKDHSKIVANASGGALFTLSQAAKLRLRHLEISCGSFDCPLIDASSDDTDYPLSVLAEQVRFNVSGHNKCHAVFLKGFKDDTKFKECYFVGSNNPSLSGMMSNLQRLLSIPDNGEYNGDRRPVIVDDCIFEGGCVQFSTFGSSSPVSPVHLINNKFYAAFCRAMHVYHGEDAFVVGNHIIGVKGYRPSIESNNIGGAVWLDIYSAVTTGSHNGAVYRDNMIRDCAGVGLFVEEMFGALTGWTVTGTSVFPDSYQYDNGAGFLTSGGYGLVITGGSRRLSVGGRFEDNEVGVVIDSSLGVEHELSVGIVDFNHAHIDQNRQHGLLIRNRVIQVNVTHGTLVGNGSSASDTYDAIHITRDANTDQVNQLKLDSVVFDDELTTMHHRHCVGKTYPGMYMDVEKCTLHSLSQWINSGGTVSGHIRHNICMNYKYWQLSGVKQWFYQNRGYRSEYSDVVTVSAGYAVIDLALDASPHRASAHLMDSHADLRLAYEVDKTNRQLIIEIRDASGVRVSGDHKVSFAAAISKSTAVIG